MVTTKKEKRKAKQSKLEMFDPLADIEGVGEVFGDRPCGAHDTKLTAAI